MAPQKGLASLKNDQIITDPHVATVFAIADLIDSFLQGKPLPTNEEEFKRVVNHSIQKNLKKD